MKGGRLLLATLLLTGLPAPEVRADGGTLRLRERAGNYRVAVFTSPAILRAGPIDVSVLVQDAATGEHAPQARVTVRLVERNEPAVTLEHHATVGAATNKLFHAAELDLPRPGRWGMEVEIDGPRGRAEVRCEVEAAEPLPRWREVWPWIAWPAGVVGLFAVHQWLVRRASRSRTASAGGGTS
jgi:hypothetical protein